MKRFALHFWLLSAFAAFAAACGSDHGPTATEHYPRDKLLDPQTCNECHQDFYQDWSASMHAYASSDPLFLAMNKRGQEETHGALGNFCVNCHAPMAARELGDGGAVIDPETIPDKLKGVTCYFCHNVTDVAGTHNNPLVLANDTTMRGGIKNPVQFKAHEGAYAPLQDGRERRSGDLCGACHDIVVPAHFSGATLDPDAGVGVDGVKLEQTYSEWRSSTSFAGPPSFTCGACHMQSAGVPQPVATLDPTQHPPGLVNRTRHRHDFPAVDTAFSTPSFPGRDAYEQRVSAFLDGTLRVETCVGEGANQGNLRVTLENVAGGHRFPSGASQDRRLWIELHVFDAAGKDVYQSGVVPAGQSVVQAAEDAAAKNEKLFLFRDETTKLDGSPAHMFWDVARIKSRTIPVPTPGALTNSLQVGYSAGDTHVLLPSRVTVTVWLEAVGLDVIDDLVKSGHLPAGDAGPSIRDLMPRRTLIPSRLTVVDAAAANLVTLEWTPDAASKQPGQNNGDLCLQTSQL